MESCCSCNILESGNGNGQKKDEFEDGDVEEDDKISWRNRLGSSLSKEESNKKRQKVVEYEEDDEDEEEDEDE